MNWKQLEKQEQLSDILKSSEAQPIVVFKHSTRCIISKMAKDRLEREWDSSIDLPFYYLDLLNYRDISNSIVEQTGIEHQSPQVLVLKNGKCVYTTSHGEIHLKSILDAITY